MSHDPEDTRTYVAADDFAAHFFVPPPPAVKVTYGGATHVGKVRANNEDHFAVIHRFRSQHMLLTNLDRAHLPAFRDESFGFVVTDGLGGAAAGEVASRLAIEEAWELSAQASSWIMRLGNLSDQQARERIQAYANRMHEKLLDLVEADRRLEGMGTTWTSVYVVGWDAIVVQIGDSRAYRFRDGTLEQLTRDHTLASSLMDYGAKAGDVAALRHIVTNTLGGGRDEVFADVDHVRLESGDRLLLCTDGLSDVVPHADVVKHVGGSASPQAICDALIQAALDRGGKDNVTVVVAAFEEP
jgi:serine/threonine protein phosphatase PrpC